MSARSLRIALALGAIYLIWGSTYLAIRFAVETLPPLLMAGVRFLVAGTVLHAWVAWRGQAVRPTGAQWRAAAGIGGLMLLVANGGVCIAELTVPSGLAALLIATVPIWIVIFDWIRPGGSPPGLPVAAGILIGFAGAAVLLAPGGGGAAIPAGGGAILTLSCIAWAAGSILSRHAPHPPSTLQTTAMQMLCGGGLLALAATYAYVNPVVAVLLGGFLAAEPLTPRILLAGAVIIAGVALIIAARSHAARPRQKGDSS